MNRRRPARQTLQRCLPLKRKNASASALSSPRDRRTARARRVTDPDDATHRAIQAGDEPPPRRASSRDGSTRRTAGVATLLAVLAACASPLADYSGYAAPRAYPISCDAGWQHAGTALKANGFRIDDVQRAAEGGVVVGKRGSETMEMKVSCDSSGLWVTPSGLTPYAENGMRIAFQRVLETSRASRPATGLEVSAELVRGPEGKLYFQSGLSSFAMAAVRLRVANGGMRPVRLLWQGIQLRTASGTLVSPTSAQELRLRFPELAAELLPQLLEPAVLKTGNRAEGFVVVPDASYEGAVIKLIDVETGEAEEFDLIFP